MPTLRRTRLSFKAAQHYVNAYNARNDDTLVLYAAYGAYRVDRVVDGTAGATSSPFGSKMHNTPREALAAANIALID